MSKHRSIKPSDTDIDDVLCKAYDGVDQGSAYPGLTYEDGIIQALEWVFGDMLNPFDNEDE